MQTLGFLFKRVLGLIKEAEVIKVHIYEIDLLLDRALLWGFTLVFWLHDRSANGALCLTLGAFKSARIDVGVAVWPTQAANADFS